LVWSACGLIAFAAGFGFIWGTQLARILAPKSAGAQSASSNFLPMLTCYYAHPMEIYGTTRETEDIQLLESLGFYVVNPNLPAYKTKDMGFFCALAARADAIAFRSLPDGKISPGVASEIKHAKRLIELPGDTEGRSL
jgi:hypothetical protein